MPEYHVLEGNLDKDHPLGWLSHYKLSGKWINYWLAETLPTIPEGSEIRIVVEVND